MLAVARQRIGQRATILEAAAETLPFGRAAFQLVTSTNALHDFPDASTAQLEMRRVITPTGNLIINDWCRDYTAIKLLDGFLAWTRHAHVHSFGQSELELSLARAGFRTVGSSRKKIDWFRG